MRRISLFILVALNINLSFGADYSKIDKQSGTIPSYLKTAPEIAGYLTKGLTNPTEKVRAIYYWISHNIKYDVSLLGTVNISYQAGERNLLNEVLNKRMGVCQHYAVLFNACCKSVGIQSYTISGYTTQNGVLANLSHAWNAVVINGNYYEIDATWAAGYIQSGKFKQEFTDLYFLISPTVFIRTHMPFDPIWQFLNNPITHVDFKNGDFSRLNIMSDYNFTDSIKVSETLDSLSNLIRSDKRIQKSGLTNSLIKTFIFYNQQNIVQLKYNQAVKDFNKAVQDYNIYIMSKNKQFNNTTLPDDQILELLSAVHENINKAENGIKFLNGDGHKLWESILAMQTSINKLRENTGAEDAFVKKYISTWKPARMLLFVR